MRRCGLGMARNQIDFNEGVKKRRFLPTTLKYATLDLLFGAFLSPERESGYHTRIPLKKTSFRLNLSAGLLK